jgi:ketosteroid isomerase-like protein
MSLEEDGAVFRQAVRNWSDGNLDGVLALLGDDVVHTVNVDALKIPWASSAVGKADVSARLKLIIDTFVVDAFVIENLVYEEEELRAAVLGYHVHRKTGERLDVRLRFRVRVRDGLIVRLDEFLDAAYIDAFERFVRYLEQAAQEAGGLTAR